jgi:hypothetical protein
MMVWRAISWYPPTWQRNSYFCFRHFQLKSNGGGMGFRLT